MEVVLDAAGRFHAAGLVRRRWQDGGARLRRRPTARGVVEVTTSDHGARSAKLIDAVAARHP